MTAKSDIEKNTFLQHNVAPIIYHSQRCLFLD